MSVLFVNLPVASLDRATAFYLQLGFAVNLQLSGAEMTALAKGRVQLLLHTHAGYQQAKQDSGSDSETAAKAFLSLQVDTRDEVARLYDCAMNAGAKAVGGAIDHGLVYGRSFSDPDAHCWQVFWMGIQQ
ncbi:VOC family protein [Pontibacter sp. JAM-7]|uniref:VOC family protein n=1 Tax=Pontibacter sp. JAM-7 TaxID=3366581 RepID=UPI003AF951D2